MVVFFSSFEAVENVPTVIDNLLKVQSKLEIVCEKLAALKTSEAEKTPSCYNN